MGDEFDPGKRLTIGCVSHNVVVVPMSVDDVFDWLVGELTLIVRCREATESQPATFVVL